MTAITRRIATVELADGRILTARVINPDTLRYEQTAHRNSWPGMTMVDGVATLGDTTRRMTFEAWAALKRTDQYAGSWDQFSQTDCLDVEINEEEVNPTQSAAAPDSSPSSHGTDAEVSKSLPELTMP